MERKIMNRIGFSILLGILLIGASCRSQSFFWSHNCCCDTVAESCVEYGLLYNWYAATDARNITSSDDWVVPTEVQYNALSSSLGGDAVAGGKLKETGLTYWSSPNTGADNSSGMNGRGAAKRNSTAIFEDINVKGFWWTKDTYPFAPFLNAKMFQLAYNTTIFNYPTGGYTKTTGLSVRLLYVGAGTPTSYVGNDGHEYRIVQIGSQYWLADNLMETQFRNGDIIPWYGANPANYFTDAEWAALTTAGMCAYDNDVSYVGCDFQFPSVEYVDVNYGYLYNWWAAIGDTDGDNIPNTSITSSADWVLLSFAEFLNLASYLGDASIAGGKMKDTSMVYWNPPNTGATNSAKFNTRGCGYRDLMGGFGDLKSIVRWWTYTEASASNSYAIGNQYNFESIQLASADKNTGYQIFIRKQAIGVPDLTEGIYVGNNGFVYKTIAHDGYYYLASPLAETLYRDGSPVPIVSDSPTWAGLTNGAMCAYENDESNAINP